MIILWLNVQFVAISAQNTPLEEADAQFIRTLYDVALTDGNSYRWLAHLCEGIGGRLAGSPQSAAAIAYTHHILDTLGMDSVWLQPCTVPVWVRGGKEMVRIVNSSQIGTYELNALALGHSVGTGPDGLTAAVIEVQSLEEVEKLGREKIAGKIVFYNRPMDPTQLNTFAAYGGAVDQRGLGASKAAVYGAVGTIVRSMTTRTDDIPHTGTLRYQEGVTPIPAVAISTRDADLLSRLLRREEVRVHIRTTCSPAPDAVSYNVIGEIRGSEYPDEIILVGGHLDSWDVGQGAHDDGAGCVQAMDVVSLLKKVGYRPKRTIRCVLFMNEESGLGGAKAYWEASNKAGEFHLAAIESDRGGFTPRGFTAEGDDSVFSTLFQQVYQWSPLLEPYGLTLKPGGSGADISGLKSQKGLLLGLEPDSQRYFDYHHTAIDTFDAVNKRELELGAAAMTALVYLLDSRGLRR
ncbi:MAG: M20/M25/M40 family metallo-hydrolase [Saprospiraceae bacterium]